MLLKCRSHLDAQHKHIKNEGITMFQHRLFVTDPRCLTLMQKVLLCVWMRRGALSIISNVHGSVLLYVDDASLTDDLCVGVRREGSEKESASEVLRVIWRRGMGTCCLNTHEHSTASVLSHGNYSLLPLQNNSSFNKECNTDERSNLTHFTDTPLSFPRFIWHFYVFFPICLVLLIHLSNHPTPALRLSKMKHPN